MNELKQKLTPGRVAAVVLLAALLYLGVSLVVHPNAGFMPALFSLCLFGAVTITYTYPTNQGPLAGGNVAPTQTQMGPESAARYNSVIATIVASAAADTSAVVTHNFQLLAGEISQGFPRTLITFLTDPTSSPWFVASQNPNYTVFQKNTLATGATAEVFIDRPITAAR